MMGVQPGCLYDGGAGAARGFRCGAVCCRNCNSTEVYVHVLLTFCVWMRVFGTLEFYKSFGKRNTKKHEKLGDKIYVCKNKFCE